MLDAGLHNLGKYVSSCAQSAGQPLVLVFARDWGAPSVRVLEGIRAELRGLGAALIVLGERSLFSFRPDDELDVVEPPEHWHAGRTGLLESLGLEREAIAENRLILCLLDGAGRVRFRRAVEEAREVPEALLAALHEAGKNAARGVERGALLSRREVVVISLTAALGAMLSEGCKREAPPPAVKAPRPAANRELLVRLRVNGKAHELMLEPRVSLLDALRERLGMTGTKKGCDHGQCGACTVLLEGSRVNACLILAVMAQRKEVTTIEGLAAGEQLHALQQAFVTEDALQCGYCTPGQIMSAAGLLKENRARTDDEVREHMSGNICRCGAYTNIVKAIQSARAAVPT